MSSDVHRSFALTKNVTKGWWIVACGTCGEEQNRYSFASAAAFVFKHMRCKPAEEGGEG
jgi:hypothetical protein